MQVHHGPRLRDTAQLHALRVARLARLTANTPMLSGIDAGTKLYPASWPHMPECQAIFNAKCAAIMDDVVCCGFCARYCHLPNPTAALPPLLFHPCLIHTFQL